MNTMLEPVLNSAPRSFASEAEWAGYHSKSRAAIPGLSPEHHPYDFAWSADRRYAVAPAFQFTERGIPSSPLHDV
jgi:hypothetical protein